VLQSEFDVGGRRVDYEVGGGLTISDTLYAVDAAREGIGLAYTFEQLVLPHIRSKQLKRVLTNFSPTFPGFYLYYPSRRQSSPAFNVIVDALRHR